MGLTCSLFCAEAAAQRPTVALDLSGLDAAAYRRLDAVMLESRAVLRLVQEGFAVVSPTARPELTIRLSTTANSLRMETPVAARTVRLDNEQNRELHFEVAQKIVELARESLRDRADGGVPDAGLVDAGSPPPHAAPPPELKAEASLGGGALIRGGGVDPRAQLDVRLPLGQRLTLDVLIALSVSNGPGISVLEPELLAGVGYRISLGERWRLELRALAGASLHVYSLDDPTAVDLAGSRGDFLMALPLTLGWNPVGRLQLGLHVTPGLSSRAREHRRGGVSLWRRDALRLGLGATVGWQF